MYRQSKMLLMGGALLTALATTVPFAASLAQTGDTKSQTEVDRLASQYSTFAGSDANALALVTGLRDDSTITLTPTDTTQKQASFDPATSKLGFGNINIALALAKKELADLGISQPSPEQIQAVMNGGTVGSDTFPGILKLRAEGMGWGQIANSLGFKLGEVVSASHSDKSRAGMERTEKTDKAEHPDKPDRAARPDHVDRPHRPAR
jgi:hypothetical protein